MQFDSNSQLSSETSPAGSPVESVSESRSAENQEHLPFEDADDYRAATYRVLARVFRAAPDDELLRSSAECGDDEANGSKLTSAWTDLAEASRRADPAKLDHEFNALFIGLGRGEVLPYASWYLSGFLLDKPLARLRADLHELGIERAEDVLESEDHFAAVCETMALLVDTTAGIDHAGQKKFFEQHVQPWVARAVRKISSGLH